MPMNRKLYPKDWEAIAFRIKAEANWCCSECSKQCLQPGEKISSLSERGRRTLTVHHRDEQPQNCSRENLVALCAPCHLRAHRKSKALDPI